MSPRSTKTTGTRGSSERAILDAAAELLDEGGVPGLTIEGVAAQSGVAKTTIYRRWRDRDELALAVLVEATEHVHAPADVGDTRKELLAFVRSATKIIVDNGIIQGLASRIATDPQLASVYRERVVELRRSEVATMLERGIARGDLRADLDIPGSYTSCSSVRASTGSCSAARRSRAGMREVVDSVMRAYGPRRGNEPACAPARRMLPEANLDGALAVGSSSPARAAGRRPEDPALVSGSAGARLGRVGLAPCGTARPGRR